MAITLKPLTAYVTLADDNKSAAIVIKNEDGEIALGPLVHRELHTKHDPTEAINDHLAQLRFKGLNIVSLESNMPGIELK